jgi:hypothetical protein
MQLARWSSDRATRLSARQRRLKSRLPEDPMYMSVPVVDGWEATPRLVADQRGAA